MFYIIIIAFDMCHCHLCQDTADVSMELTSGTANQHSVQMQQCVSEVSFCCLLLLFMFCGDVADKPVLLEEVPTTV